MNVKTTGTRPPATTALAMLCKEKFKAADRFFLYLQYMTISFKRTVTLTWLHFGHVPSVQVFPELIVRFSVDAFSLYCC